MNPWESICIGCGCTDMCACEHGCSWLARADGLGVCSSCSDAMPAWRAGARLARWLPELLYALQLQVELEDAGIAPYRPGTGQPAGKYFVVNDDACTLFLVDEQGRPAVGKRQLLRMKGEGKAQAHADRGATGRKPAGAAPFEPVVRGRGLARAAARAGRSAAGRS